ncbi:MAG: TRAP transporter small permease subunit [Gammaproteobacteria bacterium]|nr:TRAP transporter small permease subunit [Gammaproteobacteria bacterium]
MLDRLRQFASIVEQITEWTGRLISWLVLFMVVVMFIVVVLRYMFNVGWIAMQESVTYAHVLVFMLGTAFAMKHNQHVRVDIFYQRYSPSGRAWINIFGSVFLLLPVAVYIFSSSYEYVLDSISLKESSREAGGLPFVYLLKLQMLIMAGLLVLQALAEIIRNAFIVVGIEQEGEHG